jgi:putative transcriptional regulator
MVFPMLKIKLNELLEQDGKTLYWLSKQTDISYNALSKISKNKVTRIELTTIERICLALKCSVSELIVMEQANQ